MAKYFNTTELFTCTKCDTEVRREELYDDAHRLRCPNCDYWDTHMETHRVFSSDYSPDTRVKTGILVIRYMGYGEIFCPEVSVQEDKWEPVVNLGPNTVEDSTEMEWAHILRLYSGLDCIGCTRPWKMPGLDIVPGGGQLVLPFLSTNRLWINGEEVFFDEFYDDKTNSWEYFL